jgi:hypothetical protein
MAGMQSVMNQAVAQPVQQPVQQPMPQITPEMVQAIIASQMQPVAMERGLGAARFLTGEMGLPMQFGVDIPTYQPFQMQPGDFASFVATQDFRKAKNPVIPVFDPTTGGYIGMRTGGQVSQPKVGADGIIGYTQTGEPIYSQPPSQQNPINSALNNAITGALGL